MIPLEFLRQFRVDGYAIFDFAAAFLLIFLLAPLLSKLFSKLRLSIPKKSWMFFTLPLSIVAHLLAGNITPMTRDFISLHDHYLLKIFILGLLILGLKNIKIIKKTHPPEPTQDLISRLKKAQKTLSSRKFDLKKLDMWGDEIVAAFNRTMNSMDFKTNIKKELKTRRTKLKSWKLSWVKTLFPLNFRYLLSTPFIYGMIIPGVFFHLGLEIYHQVCFRIYGIPRVKSKDYFIYDRHLLPYLNWFEKLNCIYCSYFNNLLRYATEISGRTERYWCPVKHATRLSKPHSQYKKFADYLDAKDFREKWEELRNFSDIEDCDFKNPKK
jgi:hypothetical protein